jgi:hypothetical protein
MKHGSPPWLAMIAAISAAISVFLHWQTRQACRRHHHPRRATRLNPSLVDTEATMKVQLPDITVTVRVGDKKSIQLAPDHPLASNPTFSSSDSTIVSGSVSADDPLRFDLQILAPGNATVAIIGEGDPDPNVDELDQNMVFTVLSPEATELGTSLVDTPTA